VEDAAKLVVARELLAQLKSGTTKLGLTYAQAGQPIADALGEAWGSQRSRAQQVGAVGRERGGSTVESSRIFEGFGECFG
jgi:hypothetical protein